MKVNFAFHLENKVPESGGRVETHRIHVQKSTVNADIYQDILEHFMLPSADKFYGDADFILQQDLALGRPRLTGFTINRTLKRHG